jgi:hypothetical protein
MKIGTSVQAIKVLVSEICGAVMLVLLLGEIYDDAVETGSGALIYIPGFMKIGSGHTHREKVIS